MRLLNDSCISQGFKMEAGNVETDFLKVCEMKNALTCKMYNYKLTHDPVKFYVQDPRIITKATQ